MTPTAEPMGILVISHGSRHESVNRGFEAMVTRVASRLENAIVLPSYLSVVQPDIPSQVAALAARGVRRVFAMPYFLFSGQHANVDIPALLDACRSRFPALSIELLPTLENDPAMENLLVERLGPLAEAE